MEHSSHQDAYRSVDAWIAASEARIAASQARMRRLEQFASARNRMANVMLWGIFLICLAAGMGIIALAVTDGSVTILVALAAIVALSAFALVDYSFVWRMAGNCARRKIGPEAAQD
jgi:hypothetical protein